MPVYSIEQWRKAVGIMAAIAASKRENLKICEKKDFQKQRTKCMRKIMWIVILLLIRPHSVVGSRYGTEDTIPIEYCPTTEPEKLVYSTTRKSILKSSLLLLLLAALVVAEANPFLVEMLLMMSGDVEPNPGPTILTSDHLSRLVDILHEARDKWEHIGVQLGLSQGTRNNIRSEYYTNEDRLLHMFEKWLNQVEPPPSLEDLIKALRSGPVDCERFVKDLKDEFCPEYRAGKHGRVPLNQPKGVTTKPDSKDQQSYLQPTHNHQKFPEVETVASVTMHHTDWSQPEFEAVEIPTEKQLEAFFKVLLSKTHEIVKMMDSNTFNFALLSLAAVKKWNKRFDMKDLVPNVELTTPTAEVWDQLSPHFNFLDTSLLECIIEISGRKLQCEFNKYMKMLDLFATTSKPASDRTPRKRMVNVLLSKPLGNCTFEDIELSRKYLTSHCSLPSFAVVFGYVDQRSNSVCFFAPTATAYHLLSDELPLLDSGAHQSMGRAIVYVIINKMTCYHRAYEYDYNTESALEGVETRFQNLVTKTESVVKSNNSNTFWDRFSSLPVCHRWHSKFILEKLFPVRDDITKIWAYMKFYINFLNYGLLEHAIKVTDNKELMREMEECKHEIDLFRSRTKLCDFIACWPDSDTEPPEEQLQKVVKLKVNKSWEECTLRDLEEARRTLTSRFFLPDFAVFLEKISKNSIHIVLRTSTNVAQIFQDELAQTNVGEKSTFPLITESGTHISCEPLTVYDLLQEYMYIYKKYKHPSKIQMEKLKEHSGFGTNIFHLMYIHVHVHITSGSIANSHLAGSEEHTQGILPWALTGPYSQQTR